MQYHLILSITQGRRLSPKKEREALKRVGFSWAAFVFSIAMKPARLSPEAYMKICLHASKYNRAAVNGILIAKNRPSETEIKIIDSIPLSHLALANSFTTELALQLVEEYCKESDLSIVGYYQSNTTAEPSLDLVAQRISESLSRDTDNTVFLMVSSSVRSVKWVINLCSSDFPKTSERFSEHDCRSGLPISHQLFVFSEGQFSVSF